MIRILFLIAALNRGGAERQLTLLVKELNHTRFAVTVVTIYDGGSLRAEIENLPGVEVLSLHKSGRKDIVAPLLRLIHVMRRTRPRIVHGYLGIANILALLVGKPARAKVVWGIRASDVDYRLYDRRSALVFRLSAWLSRFPDLIVANSEAGRRHHIASGYSGRHMIVIPNGFDTNRFRPDSAAGRERRRVWGIADHEPVIGLVARLDPIKDHRTFLRAAALLSRQRPDVRFVCAGGGPAPYRQELETLAAELGLTGRLIWAGEQDDMLGVHNALDIATSSSVSEGFPNTVGEAMACGVPCVVTDVGDAAILVGATGCVVPVGQPAEMAAAWDRLLALSPADRQALGQQARQRIVEEFSLRQLVFRTEAALEELLSAPDSTRT